jgi:uncharacterized protein (UPF0332 family)
MVSEVELFMNRAGDEFLLAETDMRISNEIALKQSLGIPENKTFYHSVISHAYYSIFHAAKAYLFKKGIKIGPPKEHKKTFNAFSKKVREGVVDKELLAIYETELTKASVLIEIFREEKKKRGIFTYNVKSEANLPFAQESIENARKFITAIKGIV